MEQRPKCKRRKQVNLHDLELDVGFLAMRRKVQATKEKIGKLDLTKIKNFCVSKDTVIFPQEN